MDSDAPGMDQPNEDAPDTDDVDHAPTSDKQFTLAEKLGRLFTTRHPAGRGPFTLREVADLVAQQESSKHAPGDPPPVKISFSYLSQLRSGVKDNPSFKQLAALAEFFGVPVSYFTGSAPEVDRIDAELALGAAMRDSGVRDLALRASHLTPAGLRALAGVLQSLEDVPGMVNRQGRRGTELGREQI
jgi:transcriptional regulator with XRE-family HTH domain